MSTTDSNQLSDSEVHRKLQQYGLQNIPISGTRHATSKSFNLSQNWRCIVYWCLTILFTFAIVGYLRNIAKTFWIISERNTHYILCGRTNPTSIFSAPGFICIEKERLLPALAIIHELLPLLNERAEHHFCHDPQYPLGLSVSEFLSHLFKKGNLADLRNVESAQYLITCNPQWNIGIVTEEGVPAIFNGVNRMLSSNKIYFQLMQSKASRLCMIRQFGERFQTISTLFIVLIFIGLVILVIYYYVSRRKARYSLKVAKYLIAIVEELKRCAEAHRYSVERVVLINQLRDKIIPCDVSNEESESWNEAVRLLEGNGNKIRCGVMTLDGREVLTMEWIENIEFVKEDTTEDNETNC